MSLRIAECWQFADITICTKVQENTIAYRQNHFVLLSVDADTGLPKLGKIISFVSPTDDAGLYCNTVYGSLTCLVCWSDTCFATYFTSCYCWRWVQLHILLQEFWTLMTCLMTERSCWMVSHLQNDFSCLAVRTNCPYSIKVCLFCSAGWTYLISGLWCYVCRLCLCFVGVGICLYVIQCGTIYNR